jgi:hypothetical protein
MASIAKEVERAGAAAGCAVSYLTPAEANAVRQDVEQRFGSKWPLWESARRTSGVHDPNGWRRLRSLISGPCYLLFNPGEETSVFLFRSECDLVDTLSEAFGFEFYVWSHVSEKFYCFNHHDVLVTFKIPVQG